MPNVRPTQDTDAIAKIILDARFQNPELCHEGDYKDATRAAIAILDWLEAGKPEF